jgi:hypothetical protein
VISRRQFVQRGASFLALSLSTFSLLGLSQCNSGESDALKNLRNILNAVESALKFLVGMGLVNELVQIAAKYLTSVTTFVNAAAEVLEDVTLSAAQQAAKIVSLGAGVVLPHVNDPRVQSTLQTVQAAVMLFLQLFQSPNTVSLKLDDKNKRTLDKIEKDAAKDGNDVERWAASPHPAPAGAPS